jgi:hypothetical protein
MDEDENNKDKALNPNSLVFLYFFFSFSAQYLGIYPNSMMDYVRISSSNDMGAMHQGGFPKGLKNIQEKLIGNFVSFIPN